MDLVEPAELEKVRSAVRAITATATVIDCQLNGGSCVDVSRLLDLNSFSIERALEVCNAAPQPYMHMSLKYIEHALEVCAAALPLPHMLHAKNSCAPLALARCLCCRLPCFEAFC